MKTEKRTHRQWRQSVFIFGLAMAIFNFINHLFCQRRTTMKKSAVIFVLLLVCAAMFPCFSYATSTITENTTWGNETITDNIMVAKATTNGPSVKLTIAAGSVINVNPGRGIAVYAGATIEIQPGVVFNMESNTGIGVDGGTLIADGAIFQGATEKTFWGSIHFSAYGGVPAKGSISNCQIIGANGGITIGGSSPSITGNRIKSTGNSGISVSSFSSSTITNNIIEQSGINGIDIRLTPAEGASSVLVSNNLIIDSREHGIYVNASESKTNVLSNTVVNCRVGIGIDTYCTADKVTVEGNIVTHNAHAGISGGGGGKAQMGNNNVWNNNDSDYYGITKGSTDISVDPLYVDYFKDNFQLQSSSPCKTIGAYSGGNPPSPSVKTYVTTPTTSGNMAQNERWSGTVTLTGSVTVLSPYILIIEPGTTVNVPESAGIFINNSRLFAQGTASAPIVFKPVTEGKRWNGISLSRVVPSSTFISNCQISGAQYGIAITECEPMITDSVIRNCYYGIFVSASSVQETRPPNQPVIRNNTVEQNTHGIYIYVGSPIVENNLAIDNTETGIYFSAIDKAIIRFNTVAHNRIGINVNRSQADSVIENNIVTHNTGAGFSGGDSTQIGYNNVWNNNDSDYYLTTKPAADISVDPLYVNYDAKDFHLQNTSLCKTAGTTGGEIGRYGSLLKNFGLADVIGGLKVLAGIAFNPVNFNADADGNGKVDMQDVIYLLQKIAGQR